LNEEGNTKEADDEFRRMPPLELMINEKEVVRENPDVLNEF